MFNKTIKISKEAIKREWIIAFISTAVMGFLIHTFVFTNTLLNHDGIFNYYSSQNMTSSGRWLLSFFCGFSSYFHLPWLIGAISVLFIALTAAVVVDTLKIENRALIIITGGIIVSFPAIVDTFYFLFTADGYMIAMFMSACAVRLSLIDEKGIYKSAASAILLCCTCAIYQAYISFAMVLALIYFIIDICEGKRKNKEYLIWITRQVFIYAAGMILYYVIWKLCMHFQGAEATTYLGIDKIGQMQRSNINGALVYTVYNFFSFFLKWNIFEYGLTVWIVLNIIFIIFAAISITNAIFKSKVYKRKLQFFLALLAGCAIPVAIYIWLFVTLGVGYTPRMEQSFCLLYIFIAILAEKWMKDKHSSLIGVLLVVFIFNNSVVANKYYFYMERACQKSYTAASEIATRIHQLDEGQIKKIAVGGMLPKWTEEDKKDRSGIGSLGHFNSINRNIFGKETNDTMAIYLHYEFGFELAYYANNPDVPIPVLKKNGSAPIPDNWTLRFPMVSAEELEDIMQTQEYIELPCWPHKDCVAVIGETAVVKLSNDNE